VILDVSRRTNTGGLDAHVRRTIAESGLEASARQEMDYLKWLPSPREWWLLAYTRSGELVGLTIPGHHHSDPVVAYIGVVPEHRGSGYAYDLLVEATHRPVAQGVDRIVAGTDVTNTPMVATSPRSAIPSPSTGSTWSRHRAEPKSRWSKQASRVTLKLKVRSPMAGESNAATASRPRRASRQRARGTRAPSR
jgi:hypothetical protein